jgi:hypothetical protein
MNTVRFGSITVLLLGALVIACGPGEKAEPGSAVEDVADSEGAVVETSAPPEEAVERAKEAADALAAEMMGRLVRELSESGPADDHERRVLEEMEALQRSGGSPVEQVDIVTEGGRKRLRYLRPLTIKKPCLACHGETAAMDDEVRGMLAQRYPDDRAVGYSEGDLRGAISVAIRLDSATEYE